MLKWNDPKQFLLREAAKIAVETAIDIETGVKTESLKPKSGRRYGSHQASAPGEPWATKSGRYAKSIEVSPPDISGDRVEVFVGVRSVPYAVPLETTKNRPVWGKEARRARRDLEGRLKRRRRR